MAQSVQGSNASSAASPRPHAMQSVVRPGEGCVFPTSQARHAPCFSNLPAGQEAQRASVLVHAAPVAGVPSRHVHFLAAHFRLVVDVHSTVAYSEAEQVKQIEQTRSSVPEQPLEP